MKSINKYKSLIEELYFIYANFEREKMSITLLDEEKSKVSWDSIMLAKQIKEDLIGDGKEAEFRGRLKTAFFELGTDLNFASYYFPVFNTDGGEGKQDVLKLVYGDEATKVTDCLQEMAKKANDLVQDVIKTLVAVCNFVGYTPEQRKGGSPKVASDTQTAKEPQQQKVANKRGRPTKPFVSNMIDDTDGEKLKRLHLVIKGKTGKDAVLVILVAIKKGWLTKPTHTQVQKEFGDIASKTIYNRYLNEKSFTKEEIEGVQNCLIRK